MVDDEKDKRAVARGSDWNEDDVDNASDSPIEEVDGGEATMEIKPVEKKPSTKKDNLQQSENLEDSYPDITEQIRRFAEAELPSCPHCGSDNTASVQVGMIGRAITIAESTPKVKLVPSAKDKLGLYFCNACGKYFN